MICLYAIIKSADGVAGLQLRGLENQVLEYLSCGNIAAAFTHHAAAPIATAENVVHYEQVIERLMAHVALLPVRFGTCFSSEDRARAALNANQSSLAEGLEAVRGHVEMGVRILSPQAPTRPAERGFARGTDYMHAKLAQRHDEEEREQEQRRLAREILGAVTERWPRHVQSAIRHGIASCAFLIPQDNVEAFRSAIRTAMTKNPELRLLCTGPWPAYHFTPALSHAGPCHA